MLPTHALDEDILAAVKEYAHDALDKAVRCADKQQRDAQQDEVYADTRAHFEEIYPENMDDVNMALEKMTKEIVRHMITVEKIRPDGRQLDEVRSISVRVGVLPRTHGSGLFTRGQTQVLNICTLAPLSENRLSTVSVLKRKNVIFTTTISHPIP